MKYNFVNMCIVAILVNANVYANIRPAAIGFDFINNHIVGKKKYDKVFSKNLQAINGFLHYKVADNLCMEIGYELSKRRKKDFLKYSNEYLLGVVVPGAFYWWRGTSKLTIRMPYLGVGVNYLVANNTSVEGLLGLAYMQIRSKVEIKEDPLRIIEPSFDINYRKSKVTPILKLSLVQKINNDFGMRVVGGWKMLSNITAKSKEGYSSTYVKFKNSYFFGVGVFYNLSI